MRIDRVTPEQIAESGRYLIAVRNKSVEEIQQELTELIATRRALQQITNTRQETVQEQNDYNICQLKIGVINHFIEQEQLLGGALREGSSETRTPDATTNQTRTRSPRRGM